MSESPNKEFYDLLNTVSVTETSDITLSDGKNYKFRQLTTNNLKDLIKSVVDSPLTQSVFNSTVARIMKESYAGEALGYEFNIIDRLLFVLGTRIASISPTIVLTKEDKTTVTVDIQGVITKLINTIAANTEAFANGSLTYNTIVVTYGVPSITVESQLNDEIYKNVELDVQTPEQLRKLLGETFINEIAKSINGVVIGDKSLDLSTVVFRSRLKTVESLPAYLVSGVIQYIEKYKKLIEDDLVIEEGLSLPIDGSLFSLR
jgi:hypothetical protein